jgi:hypothetical protein
VQTSGVRNPHRLIIIGFACARCEYVATLLTKLGFLPGAHGCLVYESRSQAQRPLRLRTGSTVGVPFRRDSVPFGIRCTPCKPRSCH